MPASYVSARFEPTNLADSVRLITRNLDDGGVPPTPTTSYFPTTPDLLREFLVVEQLVGAESYVRVATRVDIDTLSVRELVGFECADADFITASVVPGDVLELIPGDPLLWQSEEYPGTPFLFSVAAVDSATQLTVTGAIPAMHTVSWAIGVKASGAYNGTPRRAGFPAAGTLSRTSRYNDYLPSVPALDARVAAIKAGIDSLANEDTQAFLAAESYTSRVL